MWEISISVCRMHRVSLIADFASDQPLNDLAFSLEEENPMIQWLSVHEEPLIYREFRYTVEYKSMWESEKHQLDKKRIRYCAGLKDGDCLAGVLLITSPSSKKGTCV